MECLDANAVQDLMAGALDDTARAAAILHLDDCPECRGTLGALARDAVLDVTGVDPLAATRAPVADPLAETSASMPGVTSLAETADLGPHAARLVATSDGPRLGRYVSLERIGAGAMGVVYKATDSELGRRVALKLLKRPDRELTERLVREARAMAQVTHPNVVAVYEVGVADASTYIAMELVEGASLRAWQRGRAMVEILEAYRAAGHGLAAAHAAGIVHRDFKPDNVLVGTDGRVRVTDFGLAASRPAERAGHLLASANVDGDGSAGAGSAADGRRGAHDGDGSAGAGSAADGRRGAFDVELTTAGTVLGTPAYMAPEQFTGGNVDPRTDQFNFCVALYEALHGVRPFAGTSFTELGENVCDGRMTPPPARSRVSNAVRAIVLRGLAVKPGDRYATMDHLLAELGRDRARPWRRAATVLGALAAALALWLVADIALRDRAAVEIGAAFRMTGVQTVRTLTTLEHEFTATADMLSHQAAVAQLSAHHDLADFGLGGEQADTDDLAQIHGLIESSTVAQEKRASTLAIIDAKGRLIYSTGSVMWGSRADSLPQVKHAIDTGGGGGVSVLAYDDPAFAETHLLAVPRTGLAVVYAKALSLGADDKTNVREARAVMLEVVDGAELLAKIKLSDATRLALVAMDGRSVGDATAALVAAAPMPGDAPATTVVDDVTYQVQTLAIPGSDGQGTIARLVMANPVGGLTVFPHARLVFGLLLLAALAGALGTGVRARAMARA